MHRPTVILHMLRTSGLGVMALLVGGLLFSGVAQANDKITFGLDWTAEAEYGGFYQAVATGVYAKHGWM